MSTRRCFDPQALRIRVNMSAIGSVIVIVAFSSFLSYPGSGRRRNRLCVHQEVNRES
jgi:hypothetical protein